MPYIARVGLDDNIESWCDPHGQCVLYGRPGSGKTTTAREIARRLGCEHKIIPSATETEIKTKFLGFAQRAGFELPSNISDEAMMEQFRLKENVEKLISKTLSGVGVVIFDNLTPRLLENNGADESLFVELVRYCQNKLNCYIVITATGDEITRTPRIFSMGCCEVPMKPFNHEEVIEFARGCGIEANVRAVQLLERQGIALYPSPLKRVFSFFSQNYRNIGLEQALEQEHSAANAFEQSDGDASNQDRYIIEFLRNVFGEDTPSSEHLMVFLQATLLPSRNITGAMIFGGNVGHSLQFLADKQLLTENMTESPTYTMDKDISIAAQTLFKIFVPLALRHVIEKLHECFDFSLLNITDETVQKSYQHCECLYYLLSFFNRDPHISPLTAPLATALTDILNQPDMVETKKQLAELYLRAAEFAFYHHKIDEAESYAKRGDEMHNNVMNNTEKDIVIAANFSCLLGKIWGKQEKYSEAVKKFENAFALLDRIVSVDASPSLFYMYARARQALGHVYVVFGDLSKAQTQFTKAISYSQLKYRNDMDDALKAMIAEVCAVNHHEEGKLLLKNSHSMLFAPEKGALEKSISEFRLAITEQEKRKDTKSREHYIILHKSYMCSALIKYIDILKEEIKHKTQESDDKSKELQKKKQELGEVVQEILQQKDSLPASVAQEIKSIKEQLGQSDFQDICDHINKTPLQSPRSLFDSKSTSSSPCSPLSPRSSRVISDPPPVLARQLPVRRHAVSVPQDLNHSSVSPGELKRRLEEAHERSRSRANSSHPQRDIDVEPSSAFVAQLSARRRHAASVPQGLNYSPGPPDELKGRLEEAHARSRSCANSPHPYSPRLQRDINDDPSYFQNMAPFAEYPRAMRVSLRSPHVSPSSSSTNPLFPSTSHQAATVEYGDQAPHLSPARSRTPEASFRDEGAAEERLYRSFDFCDAAIPEYVPLSQSGYSYASSSSSGRDLCSSDIVSFSEKQKALMELAEACERNPGFLEKLRQERPAIFLKLSKIRTTVNAK